MTAASSAPSQITIFCDLCGRQEFETVHVKDNGAAIYRCRECGLVFIYPQSFQEQPLSEYYQSGEVVCATDLKRFKKRQWHCRCWLGRLVLRNCYQYPVAAPTNTPAKLMATWLRSTIVKGIIPFQGDGRIVDIGCGTGLYLALLKSLGWEAWGIEVNRNATEFIRGLGVTIFCGLLQEAKFPDAYFDVVRIMHVIEHVASPREIFQEIHRILKPGGTLYLEAPNEYSFSASCFGAEWLDPGSHIYALNPDTLRSYCERNGFVLKSINFKSSKSYTVQAIRYARGHTAWGRSLCDNPFAKPLIVLLNQILDFQGKGDTMCAVIEKQS